MQQLNWPTAVLIIAIAALFVFRQPIAGWLGRIGGVKIGSLRVGAIATSPQVGDSPRTASTEELLRAFDSVVMRNCEDKIRQDLADRGLGDQSDTVRVLIRHLAATQIALSLERIDRLIFGSQLMLLQFLNTLQGASHEQAKLIYGEVASTHSEFYDTYSYEDWLGFLVGAGLISNDGDEISITQVGREFLSYLTLLGRRLSGRLL